MESKAMVYLCHVHAVYHPGQFRCGSLDIRLRHGSHWARVVDHPEFSRNGSTVSGLPRRTVMSDSAQEGRRRGSFDTVLPFRGSCVVVGDVNQMRTTSIATNYRLFRNAIKSAFSWAVKPTLNRFS
jgi:hypothetical protein